MLAREQVTNGCLEGYINDFVPMVLVIDSYVVSKMETVTLDS